MTLLARHVIALAACFGFAAATVAAPGRYAAASAAGVDTVSNGSVAGRVLNGDGFPVGDAVVSLQKRGTTAAGRTDAAGAFRLSNLEAGTYAIRVSAPGFEPLGPRPIGVSRSATTDIALALVRSSSSLLTIGRVAANGGEALSTSSAPASTMNPQNYVAEGFTRISDVLQDDISTTLVHPVGGGSTVLPTSVALRGPDPTETLVDIDGHQVNSGSTGDFDLSLLDPADYGSIELVRGISPSALVGPDTIDGAINIRTLEPTIAPHGLLRLSAGSFNTFGETVQSTGTVGRLGYALSLHNTTTDGEVYGPVFDTTLGQEARVGSGIDGQTALAKLRYAFGTNGGGYAELSFHDQRAVRDLSAGLSTYSDPTNGTTLPSVTGFEGSSLAAHNAGYALDVRVPLGAGGTAAAEPASVLFRHYTSLVGQSVFGSAAGISPYLYNDRDLIGENSLEFDKQIANGSLTLQYSVRDENLTISGANAGSGDINLESVGVRLTRDFSRSALGARRNGRTSVADAGTSSGQNFSSTDTADTLLTQTQRSAVLRYVYDPTANLHLTAAAYYSDYSSFGHETDPRFGIVYTPDARSAIRFSLGTTYQAPQLPELYVPGVLPAPVGGYITTGNPDLKPDHATEYGIGVSHVFEGGAHRTDAALDVYRVNLRTPATTFVQAGVLDQTCGATSSGGDGAPCLFTYAVNAGGAVYQGFEISAQRLLAPHTTLRAGFAVRSAFLTSVPPEIQDGTFVLDQQSLGLPLQKAQLTLTGAPSRGITFRTNLVYEGAYNELNEPPYVTADAAVGYRWPAFEVVLSGTNLTNVYARRFTTPGTGVPQATLLGPQATDAYALQGTSFNLSLARRF